MKKAFIQLSIRVVLAVFFTIIVEAAQITESSATGFLYENNPVADFSANPTEAGCYQTVTFDASASYHTNPEHNIVEYEWDFDAASANDFQVEAEGKVVTHAYTKFGTFNAWLRVRDDQDLTDITSQIINVNVGNIAPIANAGGPYTTTLGSNVMLDGRASTDVNMPCDWIASYMWDINNDGVFGDATGSTPIIATSDGYFRVGFFIIRLQVIDALGLLSNIAEAILQITDPVPVELSSFSVSARGSSVVLTWRTETEINNYGFEIERSQKVDSEKWERVGFVSGNGNSNSPKNYSFIDKEVLGGEYNYRLKQIDSDGSFCYSNEIEINITAKLALSIQQNYPNPFNPATKISYAIPHNSLVELKVFNMLGQEIATLVNQEIPAGNYEVNFDASYLPSGVYFYQLKANSFVETKKMILLR